MHVESCQHIHRGFLRDACKMSDSDLDNTCMQLEYGTILIGEINLSMVVMDDRFIYLCKIIFLRIKMHEMCNYAV